MQSTGDRWRDISPSSSLSNSTTHCLLAVHLVCLAGGGDAIVEGVNMNMNMGMNMNINTSMDMIMSMTLNINMKMNMNMIMIMNIMNICMYLNMYMYRCILYP
jgi:hypothetical protein